MIKSMTGYGRAQGSFSGGDITVEVKSVNNRYLDCGVKLPRGYAYLEESIKALVQKSISRGKVDVFVTINADQGAAARRTAPPERSPWPPWWQGFCGSRAL